MNQHAIIEAQRFFTRQQPPHANAEQLLEQCANHLAESFCLTTSSAMQIAMSVLSEIESATAEGFIDIDRSSSRMALVRDTARRTMHMVSAGELLNLVRRRARRRDPEPNTG
ncbi:hypothetical protein AB4Y64_09725 [Lysobacter sp. TAF61]|uniref:hypothetical protein n=1 Tax=Lysobacter sp. TAF61 TaxID=3233072 RepID=UPI003F9DBA25